MHLYYCDPNDNPQYPVEIRDKSKTLFFPETAMTFLQIVKTSRPRDFHVVTNCHYFACLYKQEEVFIWKKERKRWENPDFNPYGSSFNLLQIRLTGYSNTISQIVLDGNATNCMGSELIYENDVR